MKCCAVIRSYTPKSKCDIFFNTLFYLLFFFVFPIIFIVIRYENPQTSNDSFFIDSIEVISAYYVFYLCGKLLFCIMKIIFNPFRFLLYNFYCCICCCTNNCNDEISLIGKVVLITGGSRGVGKGIAIECGKAGATVYITGRSVKEKSHESLPGTITETAKFINDNTEGKCIAIKCDHYSDEEVKNVFDVIMKKEKRIDVLVNNVIHITEKGQRPPFWKQSINVFDAYNKVGMRSHFLCSKLCVPLMERNRGYNKGLIINVSSPGEVMYIFNVPYTVGKAGVRKMTKDMGYELKKYKTKISMIGVWPGIVKTERMIAKKDGLKNKIGLDISIGETTYFTGRAVVALINDDSVGKFNGKTIKCVDLAKYYGFTDVNGKIPPFPKSWMFYLKSWKTVIPYFLDNLFDPGHVANDGNSRSKKVKKKKKEIVEKTVELD